MEFISDDRYSFLFVFLGINRSGKTQTAKKLAKVWRSSRDIKKYKIVGFDPQNKFGSSSKRYFNTKSGLQETNDPNGERGLIDYYIDVEDDQCYVKLAKAKRLLIIVDDMRLKEESDSPPDGLRSLLINRAENDIDLMLIFHNPADVFNSICRLATHWFIFPVSEQDGGFKKKIPCHTECKAASNKVNDYVKDLDTTKLYPNFPYCVVIEQTKKILGYNFNHKK